MFQLDDATNDRLLGESGRLPGINMRELVAGIPSYRAIDAAFCHPAPGGSRFNSSGRGAWYAAFELETAQSEVAYHYQLLLQETAWDEEEVADYVDYLADFRAEFHNIRGSKEHEDCFLPDSYVASQALAAQLLEFGSSGIVYDSVRRRGGTCIVCFRPVLVIHVRRDATVRFVFPNATTPPTIEYTQPETPPRGWTHE
jgi:RES domain-containing protein